MPVQSFPNQLLTLNLNQLYKTNYKNEESFIKQYKFFYLSQKNNFALKFDSTLDFGMKVLSDLVARVVNSLANNKVTAISLNFSSDKSDNKFFLNELYYSARNKSVGHKDVIQKVLNYCFGTSTNNFLLKSYRGLILSILKQKIEIKDKNFIDEIIFFITNHQEYNDKKIFELLYKFLILIEINVNKSLQKQPHLRNLHYIMIIFFDLIFLRDIFMRHIKINDNFNIIEVANNQNMHPDSQLALEINKRQVKQNYIGVSQLCCVCCCLFLESFGFEFRGIAGKFEMNWSLPEQKLNNEISSLFAEKISNLIEKISQNTHPYILFENRIKDGCEKTSDTVSDDLCLFIEYYKKINLENNRFNFILNDFNNITTIEQLQNFVNFLLNIRKKFKCNCDLYI